jgi:hypothetical protein
MELFFAFNHFQTIEKEMKAGVRAPLACHIPGVTGWDVYDPVREYTRLGLIGYAIDGKVKFLFIILILGL